MVPAGMVAVYILQHAVLRWLCIFVHANRIVSILLVCTWMVLGVVRYCCAAAVALSAAWQHMHCLRHCMVLIIRASRL
jgi:hypothetical protein